jgi:putative NADH-flavin reductase
MTSEGSAIHQRTYAIVGATGNTGSSLIRVLLQRPNTQIHAFCRNKAKLSRMLPKELQSQRVRVYESSLDDVDVLHDCISGCSSVFLTAATNGNVPGCSIAMDTARSIISALEKIRARSDVPKLPKLIVLSSCSIDPHLSHGTPTVLHWIVLRAVSNVYADLKVAEKYLREHDWVTSIFMKPGGLAVDEARGARPDLDISNQDFLSYLDLAAAMVDAADDETSRYDMKNVGVVNTGKGAAIPRELPMVLLGGLLRHYFPFLHPYIFGA